MNWHIIRWMFILLTLGIVQISFAQSNEGWNIEQRCLNTPTATLPDDWSFNGTLIMTSRYKLHTFRQGWETPRIIVQNTYPAIPHNGQLSSDNKWFAVVVGKQEVGRVAVLWSSSAINIIDTKTSEKFVVDWENSFTALHSLYGHGLYWLPDKKLLYSKGGGSSGREFWHVVDPFTNTSIPWEGNSPLPIQHFTLSPNGQMRIYAGWEPSLRNDTFLYNGSDEILLPIDNNNISWHPNSTQFTAIVLDENQLPVRYSLFDLAGTEIATLAPIPEGINRAAVFPLNTNNGWSHEGHYLIFATDKIYIADMHAEILIDPCIESDYVSVTWSPDDSQLALIDRRNDDGKIQIIDFDLWERFVVGYHSGEVIG